MKTEFSLFDLLILIGIIQGIITGILLLNSKKNRKSNKFLGLTLFAFCLLSTKPLLHTLNLWDTTLFLFFPNGIELAISPLIYFYVVSTVSPKFKFKTKYWVHFIPFFIAQTYAFVVYFTALGTNNFEEKYSIARSFRFNDIKELEEYLLLVFLPFYLFYGYKELVNYKKWLDNTTSDSTFPDFNWLKNIFKLSLIIGLFLIVNRSLDLFFNLGDTTILHYNLLMLFIAFVIYYLGLKGYLQPDYTFNRDEVIVENEPSLALSETKISDTIESLQKIMDEEKVFLNPKLSIHELSTLLGVSQKSLSLAINQHFKMNFRDFVNKYRLEKVKSILNDTDYKHMSILGIALECGFNSEASFYRIFKKNTGMSPKEFMQLENNE